jgi:hypothetical protein
MRISSWTKTRPLRIYSRDLCDLQEVFRMAVEAKVAGEPTAWIAEVQTSLRGAKRRGNLMFISDHLLGDQTEGTVFLFERVFYSRWSRSK